MGLLTLLAPRPASSGGTAAVVAIPDLAARYRADQITGVASGGSVTSWSDLSGNGYTAAQATGADQPTWIPSAIGGQPAIRFNGTSTSIASQAPSAGTAQTIIAVLSSTNPNSMGTIRGGSTSGALQFRVVATATPGAANIGLVDEWVANIGDSGGAGTIAQNTGSVVAATYDQTSGAWALRINGAAAGSGVNAVALTDPNTTIIGAHFSDPEYFSGDIAELFVFNRVLTATELSTVDGYVQDRYGITVADYPTTNYPTAGTEAGAGTATGSATAGFSTSGSSTGSGGSTASSSAAFRSAGTGTGTGATTGTDVLAAAVTGSNVGTGTATGTAAVHDLDTGTAAGAGTATGAVTVAASTTGTAAGTGTTAAGSTLNAATAGTAAGVGATIGDVDAAFTATSSPTVGAGTASGAATAAFTGAGTGTGVGTATGETTAAAVTDATPAAGSGTATGTASAGLHTAGAAAGAGTAVGDVDGAAAVTGTAAGRGTSSGTATAAIFTTGTGTGAGSSTGTVTTGQGAAGTATGAGTASGTAAAGAGTAGTAAGSGTATGIDTVGQLRDITLTIVGISSRTVPITVTGRRLALTVTGNPFTATSTGHAPIEATVHANPLTVKASI